jgi:bifunctional non-homologous end joining protein LigD
MPAPKALEAYRRKRDFSKTIEPSGRTARETGKPQISRSMLPVGCIMIFGFELDGVLKSWAVAKGPSLVPGDKRLAVHVEDSALIR